MSYRADVHAGIDRVDSKRVAVVEDFDCGFRIAIRRFECQCIMMPPAVRHNIRHVPMEIGGCRSIRMADGDLQLLGLVARTVEIPVRRRSAALHETQNAGMLTRSAIVRRAIAVKASELRPELDRVGISFIETADREHHSAFVEMDGILVLDPLRPVSAIENERTGRCLRQRRRGSSGSRLSHPYNRKCIVGLAR